MKTIIVWTSENEIGLEHLQASESETEVVADGTIIRIEDEKPFRCTYRIRCDALWRVREVKINSSGETHKSCFLKTDGAGNWTDAENKRLPDFGGCLDIDISATPFTNTLPIRRLKLKRRESSNIAVVYFSLPDLTIQRSQQRYTCLEKADSKAIYRFEETGIFKGFSAEITVDGRGFVVVYPNLFKRAGSSESAEK